MVLVVSSSGAAESNDVQLHLPGRVMGWRDGVVDRVRVWSLDITFTPPCWTSKGGGNLDLKTKT